MAVSARLRYEILRRDNHTCRYCGAGVLEGKLTVDHVIPVALGGTDKPENLVAACERCNAGKSASSPDAPIVASVEDDALRWARAMEHAAQLQAAQREQDKELVARFDQYWRGWFSEDHDEYDFWRDTGWKASIARFREAGLTLEELIALGDDVMGRNIPNGRIWRYFCGACWTVIRKRQDVARELIDGGEVE